MSDTQLTTKQRRFCEEYVKDFNATQAAIRAGYSAHTADAIGKENLRKPLIKQYLDEIEGELKSESIAQSEEVLNFLTAVLRGLITRPVRIHTGKGKEEIIYLQPSISDRLRAADMLAKYYGMYDKDRAGAEIQQIIFVESGGENKLNDEGTKFEGYYATHNLDSTEK